MSAAALLAVLEVSVEDRVRCQAEGCNHTVYKRIHVVRADGRLQVLGSSCFERLFQGQAVLRQAPALTQQGGKALTEEERALLRQNTELLVARLEQQLAAEKAMNPPPEARRRPARRPPLWATTQSLLDPTVEALAKQRVRQKHGVDPEQPGWRGLVPAEARAIMAENAA